MTPGILPSAPSGPAPLFAPLLRRSAQKVTKKARRRTRWFGSHPVRIQAAVHGAWSGPHIPVRALAGARCVSSHLASNPRSPLRFSATAGSA